jgi:hypothetical protein
MGIEPSIDPAPTDEPQDAEGHGSSIAVKAVRFLLFLYLLPLKLVLLVLVWTAIAIWRCVLAVERAVRRVLRSERSHDTLAPSPEMAEHAEQPLGPFGSSPGD